MQPVLVDDRLHRRDVEDLMALRRLVVGNDRAATPAHGLGPAIVNPVDLAFLDHRAAVPLVTGLGTALLRAGPALGPVRAARAIGGRGLRGVVRVQVDPLFERLHPFKQLLDQRMALRHRPGKGRNRLYQKSLRVGAVGLITHPDSLANRSRPCKPFLGLAFSSTLQRGLHPDGSLLASGCHSPEQVRGRPQCAACCGGMHLLFSGESVSSSAPFTGPQRP